MKRLLLLTSAAVAQAIKFSMLSDVHINLEFDPLVNNTCFCIKTCNSTKKIDPIKQSNVFAPFGRLYCDPPQALTEAFLQKL